jgi:hypothetical protein
MRFTVPFTVLCALTLFYGVMLSVTLYGWLTNDMFPGAPRLIVEWTFFLSIFWGVYCLSRWLGRWMLLAIALAAMYTGDLAFRLLGMMPLSGDHQPVGQKLLVSAVWWGVIGLVLLRQWSKKRLPSNYPSN